MEQDQRSKSDHAQGVEVWSAGVAYREGADGRGRSMPHILLGLWCAARHLSAPPRRLLE
jgi:hypothetical protein